MLLLVLAHTGYVHHAHIRTQGHTPPTQQASRQPVTIHVDGFVQCAALFGLLKGVGRVVVSREKLHVVTEMLQGQGYVHHEALGSAYA